MSAWRRRLPAAVECAEENLPLSTKTPSFGLALIVTLVALRLATGWHFFSEGVKHLREPSFSEGFLWQAKGPLAPLYRASIPDLRGFRRLDAAQHEAQWEKFQQRATGHYRFDQSQQVQASTARARRVGQLKFYLDSLKDDIKEYGLEWERLDKARADRSTRDVEFRRRWINEKEAELRRKARPWLEQIAKLREAYENDLYETATSDQRRRGRLELADLAYNRVDTVVTWVTLIVGACLFVGLFTRPAALVGAAFLASVVASQPPWVPGANDIYYQVIELLALLVLAAAGAGRFAGLDFLLSALKLRCCPPKQGEAK